MSACVCTHANALALFRNTQLLARYFHTIFKDFGNGMYVYMHNYSHTIHVDINITYTFVKTDWLNTSVMLYT